MQWENSIDSFNDKSGIDMLYACASENMYNFVF